MQRFWRPSLVSDETCDRLAGTPIGQRQEATHLPVMVVMGDADQAVDVEVTRRWVTKIQELGMSYDYIEVPAGSHSSVGRENIERVLSFPDAHRTQRR